MNGKMTEQRRRKRKEKYIREGFKFEQAILQELPFVWWGQKIISGVSNYASNVEGATQDLQSLSMHSPKLLIDFYGKKSVALRLSRQTILKPSKLTPPIGQTWTQVPPDRASPPRASYPKCQLWVSLARAKWRHAVMTLLCSSEMLRLVHLGSSASQASNS